MGQNEPKSKRSRARQLLASGALGIAVGLLCQLAPANWRMPCAILVKLLALLAGSTS